MKMIVGLGNPGPQYTKTRHNVGFVVLDRLAAKHAAGATTKGRFNAMTVEGTIPSPAGGERCLFVKPTTFMNKSGQSVGEALRFFKLDVREVLVVTDDIYLPVGAIRLKPSGGTGGHNGLEDIQRVLGSDSYPRLRIGVNVKPSFMDQADYVLSRFTDEEELALGPALDRAVQACEVFATRGLDAAMNTFNTDPNQPARVKKPRPTPENQPSGGERTSPSSSPPSPSKE